MAEQAAFSKERFEDVFQDEIIKAFVNITSFEKFARSKNGLCLDQADIQTIVEDHGGNVEKQKLEMCFKWREIQGKKATVSKVRDLLQNYFRKDNPSGYIDLGNGIFGVYKTRFLCERSKVYLGVQKSEVAGTQIRAIKFVPKNEKTLREAQILVKLGSHVNVVTTLHAGIHKGEPHDYIYIAMELSWTQTVRNMIEECMGQQKPFHEFIAWSLVEQLMRAVEFLHFHNIIHRDVKPDNVLASHDWRHFKLTDYGLSKVIQDGFATYQTGANIGTLGYRSRETYNVNVKITAKVDIFSAGVTIGEIMANGKHPFGQDQFLWSYNIFNNKNLDLSHLCVSYKDQVTYFIKRMLEMDPEKRPTAKEVLHDVSVYFQTFQLKNPQTVADESSATTSKAITELYITEKVLTGTTADESSATTSKAITEPSITEKGKKATVPKIHHFYKTIQKYFRKDNSSVLTGTTADESLATTSKAITKLFITETVNVIIMFNKSDEHLYSYKLSTKEWSRMQELSEYNSDGLFTTVVSGKHIYVLQNQNAHQLEYSDPAAEWKEMASMRRVHGFEPPAVLLNGLIYVCGSSDNASRSVEQYDAALDRWAHICDMNIAREHHCVVATEDHIYCMGGFNEQIERLQSVERFDESLKKWDLVESAPRPIWGASAAVVKNRIYVAVHDGTLCYDIQNNSWSEIDLTTEWPFMKNRSVKILAVDDELYLIGIMYNIARIGGSKEQWMYAIYLLEPETKQLTLVEEFEDKQIKLRASLVVKPEFGFFGKKLSFFRKAE